MPFDKTTASLAGQKSSRAVTPELKVLLKVSKETLIPSLMRICGLTVPELNLLEKDTNSPALDILVARCLLKGISKGDPSFLQFIFDRILGRPKQDLTIDMSASVDVEFSKKSDEEILKEASDMAKTLKLINGD